MSDADPPPPDLKTRVLYVRVSEKLARELRRRSRFTGISAAAYVRKVLEHRVRTVDISKEDAG